MANSDKNILITPNVSAATGTYPLIKFTGADNTPITMRVLDNGTLSFEGTAGQLFSISDGLTGSIFSVNDISGIPSIEVLDTGLVKINQYNGQTVIGGSAAAGTARITVYSSAVGSLGLVVRALVSQTADVQQWQNSGGVITASVGPTGNLYTAGRMRIYGDFSAQLNVESNAAGVVGQVIRGAASQSADLQQWQNSAGTVLSGISPVGYGFFGTTGAAAAALTAKAPLDNFAGIIVRPFSGSQSANLTEWQDNSGTTQTAIGPTARILSKQRMSIGWAPVNAVTTAHVNFHNDNDPARIVVLVRASTSQTANLQEWQDSAGTVLSSVSALGAFLAPAATTSTPSIRLPHGTAPTSPTNGDVWTTTAGVYVRIDGTTVGPLGTGGGGGPTDDDQNILANQVFG